MVVWDVRLEQIDHYTVQVEAPEDATAEQIALLALDGDYRLGEEEDREYQSEKMISFSRSFEPETCPICGCGNGGHGCSHHPDCKGAP